MAMPPSVRWFELELNEAQDAGDAFGESCPALPLGIELLPSLARDLVQTRLPVFLGRSPRRLEPALLFHAMQRGVQRPLFHAQKIGRGALDSSGDGVAMHRSGGVDRPQHQ